MLKARNICLRAILFSPVLLEVIVSPLCLWARSSSGARLEDGRWWPGKIAGPTLQAYTLVCIVRFLHEPGPQSRSSSPMFVISAIATAVRGS